MKTVSSTFAASNNSARKSQRRLSCGFRTAQFACTSTEYAFPQAHQRDIKPPRVCVIEGIDWERERERNPSRFGQQCAPDSEKEKIKMRLPIKIAAWSWFSIAALASVSPNVRGNDRSCEEPKCDLLIRRCRGSCAVCRTDSIEQVLERRSVRLATTSPPRVPNIVAGCMHPFRFPKWSECRAQVSFAGSERDDGLFSRFPLSPIPSRSFLHS